MSNKAKTSRNAMFIIRSSEGRKSKLAYNLSAAEREAQREAFHRAGIKRLWSFSYWAKGLK